MIGRVRVRQQRGENPKVRGPFIDRPSRFRRHQGADELADCAANDSAFMRISLEKGRGYVAHLLKADVGRQRRHLRPVGSQRIIPCTCKLVWAIGMRCEASNLGSPSITRLAAKKRAIVLLLVSIHLLLGPFRRNLPRIFRFLGFLRGALIQGHVRFPRFGLAKG